MLTRVLDNAHFARPLHVPPSRRNNAAAHSVPPPRGVRAHGPRRNSARGEPRRVARDRLKSGARSGAQNAACGLAQGYMRGMRWRVSGACAATQQRVCVAVERGRA